MNSAAGSILSYLPPHADLRVGSSNAQTGAGQPWGLGVAPTPTVIPTAQPPLSKNVGKGVNTTPSTFGTAPPTTVAAPNTDHPCGGTGGSSCGCGGSCVGEASVVELRTERGYLEAEFKKAISNSIPMADANIIGNRITLRMAMPTGQTHVVISEVTERKDVNVRILETHGGSLVQSLVFQQIGSGWYIEGKQLTAPLSTNLIQFALTTWATYFASTWDDSNRYKIRNSPKTDSTMNVEGSYEAPPCIDSFKCSWPDAPFPDFNPIGSTATVRFDRRYDSGMLWISGLFCLDPVPVDIRGCCIQYNKDFYCRNDGCGKNLADCIARLMWDAIWDAYWNWAPMICLLGFSLAGIFLSGWGLGETVAGLILKSFLDITPLISEVWIAVAISHDPLLLDGISWDTDKYTRSESCICGGDKPTALCSKPCEDACWEVLHQHTICSEHCGWKCNYDEDGKFVGKSWESEHQMPCCSDVSKECKGGQFGDIPCPGCATDCGWLCQNGKWLVWSGGKKQAVPPNMCCQGFNPTPPVGGCGSGHKGGGVF